ncbi:hypothetical protein L1887_12470 [Cichorium endivia]|nr:hypothetical protein L1887_12470 [Cichorium endivia]
MSLPSSDLDRLKLSNIRDHQCNSSSSLAPNVLENDSQEDQTKMKEDTNSFCGALKVQVPSPDGEFKVSNGEDDPKTPTATEHRIPVMTTCPLAPRKAKWVPTTGKRKAPFFPGVIAPAEFMIYVDAMRALNEAVYVPDIVAGDFGAGDCAKRLKPLTPPAHEP